MVCPSCNAIYSLKDSFLQQGDSKLSQKCSSLKFNIRCNAELLAVKKQARDKSTLVPHKVFMMLDPSRWLQFLFQSSEFRSLLTAPHKHSPQADIFEDVWDGELWRTFQYDPTDGTDLLCKTENIALMLNVDWVKPFKRNQYKFGVIYLSILNLPRSERMLKKWTLVVGIIPGPSEPKTHINSFLAPLIDDLLKLWRGIEIEVSDIKERINCRAILLCISSDLPALRKVTQFLGHRAIKGCNKCLFSAEREKDSDGQLTGRIYFSNNQTFLKRNIITVLKQSAEYKLAKSESAANARAKKHGLRYSELHRLPYFDIVEMCAEDPMHALLLGLIKKEATILLQQDTSSDNFKFAVPLNKRDELRRRIKAIQIPSDCGRIPASLADKASLDGFTAQQWLLFAIAYARPVFFGLIPSAAYECLKVLCRITEKCTTHRLLRSDINELRELILKHHRLFCRLYGKWSISINNHMMLHLPDTLAKFGPSHVFWCFAFERMNGILVGVPSSGRIPEKEMFLKFLRQQRLASYEHELHQQHPKLQCAEIQPLTQSLEALRDDDELQEKRLVDREIERIKAEEFLSMKNVDQDAYIHQCLVESSESTYSFTNSLLLGPSRLGKSMDDDLLACLRQHFDDVFENCVVHISPRMDKYARCQVNGMCLSSSMNASERSSYAMAYCATNEKKNTPSKYYCKIQFFLSVRLTVEDPSGDQRAMHMPLAYVDWYRPCATDKNSGLDKVLPAFYKGNHVISVYRLVQRVILSHHSRQHLIIPLPL